MPQPGAARGHTSWQWKLHSQVVQLLGILSIALCGLSWKNRSKSGQSPLLPTLLLGLMLFLAVFGIWAFYHLPRPVIVSVHLAGGIAMLVLLIWIALSQISAGAIDAEKAQNCRVFSLLGLTLLLVQVMLGGWVSSNFAANACTDFPLCKGHLVPPMDFSYHFNSFDTPLSVGQLTAIHWMHRLGAILTAIYLCWVAVKVLAIEGLQNIGKIILGLVIFQFVLGASNVLLGLPLAGAVLHNAMAMLLLSALVLLSFRIRKSAGRA